MMTKMKRQKAYTLLELLIVLAIIAIMTDLTYQSYAAHLAATRRADAQINLLKLSSVLENYYLQHNTYSGATLEKLHFPERSPQGYYEMSFTIEQMGQSYQAKAKPVGSQAEHDRACGSLTLSTDGRRSYEGSDPKAACW